MTDDDIELVASIARMCAGIISCEAARGKDAPEPYVDACVSFSAGCQCYAYAEQFIPALEAAGWRKVPEGSVVVPEEVLDSALKYQMDRVSGMMRKWAANDKPAERGEATGQINE